MKKDYIRDHSDIWNVFFIKNVYKYTNFLKKQRERSSFIFYICFLPFKFLYKFFINENFFLNDFKNKFSIRVRKFRN